MSEINILYLINCVQYLKVFASRFFFFFHVQGPKRMLRIHCSLKAYCARPIKYSNCSHFCRQMSLRSKQRKVELFVGEKLDR